MKANHNACSTENTGDGVVLNISNQRTDRRELIDTHKNKHLSIMKANHDATAAYQGFQTII